MNLFAFFACLTDARVEGHCLRTLVLVKTERHTALGSTRPQRLYLSSLADPDPAIYARLVRGHCTIEDHLHGQLDLTFHEDPSRLRTGHAGLNINILCKTALYLLVQDPRPISFKRKRKQVAYDNAYLCQLLQKS